MKVAIEGCAHGELDKIYETISALEERNNFKVDLLLICGDFQSVRNLDDLQCLAVPPCYKKLNTFYKYYSGESEAPVLTIFIGGNHEASNYLTELSYGGWVAPNIFYLGAAGVVSVGGIRIAGLSGIYKGRDYLKGHFEMSPYDEDSKRSVYHVRNLEVFRLKQISEPLDVVMSHDWPRGVYNFGNKHALLRWKKFFTQEVNDNVLGSRPAEELLKVLKPKYWFSAHLHCKFAALVPHKNEAGETISHTKFLALDKCLPRRQFLQILDIGNDEVKKPLRLEYDLEWLCILRSTNHLLRAHCSNVYMPGPGCSDSERWDFKPSEEELSSVKNLFEGNLEIPENFVQTAPLHDPKGKRQGHSQPCTTANPQTASFCQKLDVDDIVAKLLSKSPEAKNLTVGDFTFRNEDEANVTSSFQTSFNPDEISLDDNDDDENDASDGEQKDKRDEVEIVDDLFFIDRRKSGAVTSTPKVHTPASGRSSLVMPQPKLTPGDVAQLLDFGVCDRSDAVDHEDTAKKRDGEHAEVASDATALMAVKKMKRRNQAIYQANSDSEG